MGTPLGPKYVPYTYMDPLGYGPGLRASFDLRDFVLGVGVGILLPGNQPSTLTSL